jgi:hypothetical protein
VAVEGLEKRHNYTVAIADDNGNYYFDNNFAPSGALQYKRGQFFAADGKITTSIITLRIDRSRSPEFTITDNTLQKVLVKENLVEKILSHESETGVPIDFSKQHEFNLRIVYDQATLSAVVRIEDEWLIKPGGQEDLN